MKLRPPMAFPRPSRLRVALLAGLAVALISIGSTANNASALLSAYPTTLYLSNTTSSVVTTQQSYQLVTTAPASLQLTTKNRIPNLSANYQDFSPGFAPAATTANTPASTATASTTPNNKGWIVDGSGAVSFGTGTWTFKNTVTQAYNGVGTATLAVGMWKVRVAGGAISSSTLLVDPNCSATPCTSGAAPGTVSPGTNFVTPAGTPVAISIPVTVTGFSLANGEHLYVQYWRKQTVGMAIGAGQANRLATFYVNDGASQITLPAATAVTPTLGSVAARVKTMPQLSAIYNNPVDAGSLLFQLCSDGSACSTVIQNGQSATGLTTGQTGTWTPGSLPPDGTYWWRALSQDSATPANQSDWSPAGSFVVDTVPPGTATLGAAPAAGARINSSQLNATFVDSDATDSGVVNFQLCSNASCSAVVASGSSATGLVDGGSGNWTPSVPDGTYYWRAQDEDAAGNQSAWTTPTRTFTLDTTVPVPTLGAVAALVNTAPTLSGTFTDSDASDAGTLLFEVCTDSTCSSAPVASSSQAVTNLATKTFTPTGLADGTYWARVRATDTAGNSALSAATSFRLDATPPSVALGAVAARTATTPLLSTTYSDNASTGTLSLQLCSNSTCTSVLQSTSSASGLAAGGATFTWTPASLVDGTYYWRARALDAAGNWSSWSATSSFVVDTVAPNAPTLTAPAVAARVNTTQVTATFTDPDSGDSGTLSFQLCSDTGCATVLASGTSATISGGASASWTPPGIADGVYYWRVRGQDAAGNLGIWSATRSFTLDTVAPATPSLGAPANASYLASAPTLNATFADSDAGDSGSLVFQICADSGCATVVASGSSATGLLNGAAGSWTPSTLAGGDYYWRAAGRDAAGNESTWSATVGFTLDKTPPDAPTLTVPGGASRFLRIPSLTATYSDPGAATGGSLTFQLCRTSSCASPVATTTSTGVANGTTSIWTPADIADGTYFARASARDSAGNQSAWSQAVTFVLDTTSPAAPAPTASTAALSFVRTTPVLNATLDDPGDSTDSLRMLVELCGDAACANVIATGYSSAVPAGSVASWQGAALPDGVYYWRASAEDLLGNQSASSTPRQFVVDTVAPSAPEITAPDDGALVKKARLTGAFSTSDMADAGRLTFQVCTDAACATVVASGVSARVGATGASTSAGAGGAGSWTAGDLPDGSYFWRACAWDVAGNRSAWSPTQSFTLDRTPPGKPRRFSATSSGRTLTLRWQSPAGGDNVASYALLVNSRPIQSVDAQTNVLRIHLRDGDKRSFAIAAVDEAGNVGTPTVAFLPSAEAPVKQVQGRRTPATPAPARRPRRK